MGVDFLVCERCGTTFADCGDFVRCGDDCGNRWCDEECAETDGYTRANCKLGLEVSEEGYLEDCKDECIKWKDSEEEWCECDGCENYTPTSCSYCRHEDYEDSELLKYALKMLDISRDDLIEAINCSKESE